MIKIGIIALLVYIALGKTKRMKRKIKRSIKRNFKRAIKFGVMMLTGI